MYVGVFKSIQECKIMYRSVQKSVQEWNKGISVAWCEQVCTGVVCTNRCVQQQCGVGLQQ